MTFNRPFSLMAVETMQPPGTYTIDIDEELIEGLPFLAYRQVATTIYLPLHQGYQRSVQAVRVDPLKSEGNRKSISSGISASAVSAKSDSGSDGPG